VVVMHVVNSFSAVCAKYVASSLQYYVVSSFSAVCVKYVII
jgi:hypothetical protein